MGGVILETPEMLVDNAIGNRMPLLDPYLEQLGLPTEPSESISEGMAKASEEPRGERT
jgi:flagellar assembly protein FliH